MKLQIDPMVEQALAAGGPVVALESTLICHGLPRPRNLELGRAVEAAVRAEGAEPATIAIVDGIVRVGLDADTLVRLAQADGVTKCSPRDLAVGDGNRRAWARPRSPGRSASPPRAGIRVMATGGIGGVHRGGENSLDVSADLHELARTGVAVVCSGAKIILDLPRTLEVLETLAVPVVGYRCASFPAFYARDSGLPVPELDDLPHWLTWCAPRPSSAGRPASWSPTRRQPSWRCPWSSWSDWIAQAAGRRAGPRDRRQGQPRRSCSRRWRG